MTLPSGLQTVTLTIRRFHPDGTPMVGAIVITPEPQQLTSATYGVIMAGPVTAIFDSAAAGVATVTLLATDATGVTPTGWTYRVSENWIGAPSRSYPISLPAAAPAVNLAAIAPTDPAKGTYVTVTGPQGPAGATGATGPAGVDRTVGPWVFDITAYGAVGDAKVVHDGAVTGGVPTLTCTASAPFTPALVGKSVLIQGAGANGVTAFTTTFTAYNSPTSMSLTATPPTSITGAVVVFGSNNYGAIRAATAAAEAYLNGTGTGAAATPHTYAQVYTPPGGFILDGPLDISKSGNGQVPLGVYPTTDVKKIPHFKGEGSGAGVRHWEQLVPQIAGSCWISFGFYSSASAQLADINANGNQGIISGPNEGTTNGLAYGASARYSNIMPMITNMAFLTPHTAVGIAYGAWNFYGCANAHIENVSCSTMGVVPGPDYATPGVFGTGLSIGALMPAPGNNDLSIVRNLSIQGGYTYALFFSEHTLIDRVMVLYCWAALCPIGSYAGSVGATHAMKVIQASVEACPRVVYFIGPGSSGVTIFDCDQLQTESSTPTFDGNSTAALASVVGTVKITGLFTPSGVTVVQPTGLKIVNGQVARAVTRKTANYTVSVIDETIHVDASAGPVTITLINADYTPNQYTVIKTDSSANPVNLAAAAGQLINGAATQAVTTQYGSYTAYSAYNGIAYAWYRR